MIVIDREIRSWVLLEENDELYLDVYCDISVIGYSVTIKLNSTETGKYQTEGKEYISQLALEICNSVPILEERQSPYRNRDISKQLINKISSALREWKKK